MPANTRPFRAALFDLDNTLYDREAAFGRWSDAYLRDTLHLADAEEAGLVRALVTDMDADGYGSKAAIFERLHSLYPALAGSPARSVDVFFEEFIGHITPEAETETLLGALGAAALPFGVITNGSARQWRKIENLGLARRTDCLFVSETFGGKKPERAIFEAAAAFLGVLPSETLFVGDNPAVDVLGAQAAGMRAAWLHRGHPWPEGMAGAPDFVIGSLGEVADILGIPPGEPGMMRAERPTAAQEVEEGHRRMASDGAHEFGSAGAGGDDQRRCARRGAVRQPCPTATDRTASGAPVPAGVCQKPGTDYRQSRQP